MNTLMICILTLTFSTPVFAQNLQEEKEKAFELEDETVQIHDIEAEQKAAREEAVKAEKNERERKAQLEKLRAEKAHALDRAKAEMTSLETRRKTAEKAANEHNAEITQIQGQIKSLQDQVAKKQVAAKTAEEMRAEGRKELDRVTAERNELTKRFGDAKKSESDASNDVRRMKIDYDRLSAQTKSMESQVKAMEEAARKRQQQRDQTRRQITSMQQRSDAAHQSMHRLTGGK